MESELDQSMKTNAEIARKDSLVLLAPLLLVLSFGPEVKVTEILLCSD